MRRNALGLWMTAIAASLLVGCGASHPPVPPASPIDFASGIIGGSDVPANHPLVRSVVGIYLIGTTAQRSWCTGVLLANNLVLTAAHCLTDPSKMAIFFGTSLTPQSPHARVDGAKVSPNYNANHPDGKNEGDIALLHFAGAAPAGVIPLPLLPLQKQNLFPTGSTIILAGYGINDAARNSGSGTLRMVTARLGNPNFSPMEISIDQTQGRGACYGDSGGPALVMIQNQPFIWGITNRGLNDPKFECSQQLQLANAAIWNQWIADASASLLREVNKGRNNPFGRFQ